MNQSIQVIFFTMVIKQVSHELWLLSVMESLMKDTLHFHVTFLSFFGFVSNESLSSCDSRDMTGDRTR
jgi:hypothetical protein